jgi:hypothetical protein
MEIRTSENTQFSAEELEKMLRETKIVELDQKEI